MRKSFLLALGIVLTLCAPLYAQVAVSGSLVQDVSGVPLFSGQWCAGATCLTVTSGAFSGSVTAGTYTVTVKNASSVVILSVSNVAIGGSTYNWNQYTVPYGVTFSGNGQPYLACQLAASYTQNDSTPTAGAIWLCVAQSGQLVWALQGPPTPAGPGITSGIGVPTQPAVVPTIYIRTDVSEQYNVSGATGSISTTWVKQSGVFPCTAGSGQSFTCSSSITGNAVFSATTGIPRPTYDITQPPYNAVGDGVTDDTAAIQAAFDACWNSGTLGFGGSVLFPGNHNYVITRAIYAHNTCLPEGWGAGNGVNGGSGEPIRMVWNGTANGAPIPFTSFTIQTNSTLYPAFSPSPSARYGQSLTITSSGQNVVTVTGTGGSGMTVGTYALSFSGGGGSLAAGTLTVLSATTYFVRLTNTGSGYTSAPSVSAATGGTPPTLTANLSYAAGQWGIIQNCTSNPGGNQINNVATQIMGTPSSTSFTVPLPAGGTNGSYTDTTCIFTPTTVMLAFDSNSRYQTSINNMMIVANITGQTNVAGVNVFYGSRLDSGFGNDNTWSDAALYSDYYLSIGGINIDFNDKWRSDGNALLGNIYVHVLGDNLGVSNFSLSAGTNVTNLYGTALSGPNILLDAQNCTNSSIRLHAHNGHYEEDESFLPGYGAVTMFPCTTNGNVQFFLDGEGASVLCSNTTAAQSNCPTLAVSPPEDGVVIFDDSNSKMTAGSTSATFPAAQGMNQFNRVYMSGSGGNTSHLTYSPRAFAGGSGPGNKSVAQVIGDFGAEGYWRHSLQAGVCTYSDAAFAALKPGTTLQVGETICPPAYWAATTAQKRFAMQSVITAGTVGTAPNGGNDLAITTSTPSQWSVAGPQAPVTATACSGTSLIVTSTLNPGIGALVTLYQTAEQSLNGPQGFGGPMLATTASSGTSFTVPYSGCPAYAGNPSDTGYATVSPANDLSADQWVAVAGGTTRAIQYVNATNPLAVLVNTIGSVGTVSTPTEMTWAAPVLGLEMQFPTKSAAAPTSLAWSEGDCEQNSGAVVGGVAWWCNVAAGTPGTWGGVPLGNASGVLNGSQVALGTQSTLPVCPNGGSNGSLTTSGCFIASVGNGLIEESNTASGTWSGLSGSSYTGCSGQSAANSPATNTAPAIGLYTSAATSGDCAGWYGDGIYYSNRQPNISFGVAYSVSTDYSSNARIWLGTFNCGTNPLPVVGISDNPACSYVAIRYSTVAGDTSYQCVTGNGSAQTVTPIGVAPTTTYAAMNVTVNASSATCTVGSTTVTNTTTLPAAGYLQNVWANFTQANAATHLEVTNVLGYHQSKTF